MFPFGTVSGKAFNNTTVSFFGFDLVFVAFFFFSCEATTHSALGSKDSLFFFGDLAPPNSLPSIVEVVLVGRPTLEQILDALEVAASTEAAAASCN